MRIWSLHPDFLDAKGLVALWREALLAKHVLQGKTTGYKNHPQLTRFKQASSPVNAIDQYLSTVYEVAIQRGYNFDRSKIHWDFEQMVMTVTRGQLKYEMSHLLAKLKKRDKKKHEEVNDTSRLLPHPIFRVINGKVESWEVIK